MTNPSSFSLQPANKPAKRGTALVVDDERANRLLLSTLLRRNQFEIIEASNGQEAIAACQKVIPDIVFMDVMMPVMDGYEATREIKRQHQDQFIPIIFLTALSEHQALSQCVKAGGDDFLVKPFNPEILYSRILAMERIRDLYRGLSVVFNQMQRDQEIAQEVFDTAVMAHNLRNPAIHSLIKPTALFSGDVVLTARSPYNDIHLLLGDFTGHGLAAALGALPTAEVFQAMSAKGYGISQILDGINRKLCNLLPTGMFLAGISVYISHDFEFFSICNFGLPPAFLRDGANGSIRRMFNSSELPLGIFTQESQHFHFEKIPIIPGDSLLFYTDGLIEAQNPERHSFGLERLSQAVLRTPVSDPLIPGIMNLLSEFIAEIPPSDDISLVEVPLTMDLFPEDASPSPAGLPLKAPAPLGTAVLPDYPCLPFDESGTILELTLFAHQLRKNVDPVPLLLNQLVELEDLGHKRSTLFTVLTELYLNALDHGILGLDPIIKNRDQSFMVYQQEKERRIKELTEGHISIRIHSGHRGNSRAVHIEIADSGSGFDYHSVMKKVSEKQEAFLGRGLLLVSSLADQLRFSQTGNRVHAILCWELAEE